MKVHFKTSQIGSIILGLLVLFYFVIMNQNKVMIIQKTIEISINTIAIFTLK